MDHPAVKLWRDRFHLNLSASWKRDVEKTITDLDLWKSILDSWFYVENGKKRTKHPGIKQLLVEYERQSENKRVATEASAISAQQRLATQSLERYQSVPQYFYTSRR